MRYSRFGQLRFCIAKRFGVRQPSGAFLKNTAYPITSSWKICSSSSPHLFQSAQNGLGLLVVRVIAQNFFQDRRGAVFLVWRVGKIDEYRGIQEKIMTDIDKPPFDPIPDRHEWEKARKNEDVIPESGK